MQKNQLTEKRRRKISDKEKPEDSKGKIFLMMALNSNVNELKKITAYANKLRLNIKTLKELIKEVK